MDDYSLEVFYLEPNLLNILSARMSKWTYSPTGKYAIRPEHWNNKPRTHFEMVDFEESTLITQPSNKKLDMGPLVTYWLSDSEVVYIHYSISKQLGSQVLLNISKKEGEICKWNLIATREFKFQNPYKSFVEISQCSLKIKQKEFMVVTFKGLVGKCESVMKLVPTDPRSSEKIVDFQMEFMETLDYFKQNVEDFRADFDPKPLVFNSYLMFPMICKNQDMRFLSINLAKWDQENSIISNKYMEENASVIEIGAPERSAVQFTFWQDDQRVIVIWHPIGVYTKYFVGVVDLIRKAKVVFRVDSAHGWANVSIHPSGILITDEYSKKEGEEATIFSRTKCVAMPRTEVARLSELSLEASLLADGNRNESFVPKFIRQKKDKITFRKVIQERNWFKRNYPNYENSIFWRVSRLFS